VAEVESLAVLSGLDGILAGALCLSSVRPSPTRFTSVVWSPSPSGFLMVHCDSFPCFGKAASMMFPCCTLSRMALADSDTFGLSVSAPTVSRAVETDSWYIAVKTLVQSISLHCAAIPP